MNKVTALRVLKIFNSYRRGSIRDSELPNDVTPHKIGEAIETAIETFELQLALGSTKETIHKVRR